MKNILLVIFAALTVALPAMAKPYSLPGTGIHFDAPEGFTAMTAKEIAVKFPVANPPATVVANKARTVTIAYEVRPQALPVEMLETALGAFEKAFEQSVPGLEWKARKVIALQDRKWIQLEFISNRDGVDIYNIMLITPFDQKMLAFNFNSIRHEFSKIEPALRKSMQTIVLPENK
ncbi:DcrB/PsbP domain-containing protein [Parachitinimonas caeni]|uniref:DUF1795 domain-containing protein n=1 Tax=Parachitinimonas caeni TaxID=3031301 RepID=A0ABT7DYF3_9NEIS|nr:hypothetical protein [Parachitinimonas caeni]MDK2125088.1 hypothetical protein [Parachitinimonas caeni]